MGEGAKALNAINVHSDDSDVDDASAVEGAKARRRAKANNAIIAYSVVYDASVVDGDGLGRRREGAHGLQNLHGQQGC